MATVELSGGKLFLIVMILLVKFSEKACGMSSESKEDGRGVEFFLPRIALKLRNSSLHELLVCILIEQKAVFTLSIKSVTFLLMFS